MYYVFGFIQRGRVRRIERANDDPPPIDYSI
jgi:hypothetical protein